MKYKKFDLTVLYVEDEPTVHAQIKNVLEIFFTKVLSAYNGNEALELFKKKHDLFLNPIDLLITDISMPGIDGFELIRKLRFLNPDLHAIIISAMNFGSYINDINSVSILNTYLSKPIVVDNLYENCLKIVERIKDRKNYKIQYNLTQQYKNALENTAIISKTDLNGVITYVNDAFCQISGYTKEELIGKSHNIVRHPDVPAFVFDEMWRLIKAKVIWKKESLPNRAKDGSTYYVNTTVMPILDNNGLTIEYISIRFDTTMLEQSIASERKAKESQSIFLANMSHEIRTPLNAVIGFINLMKDYEKLSKKEVYDYINIIDKSANNLLEIISDILDISKIKTGKMQIDNIWFKPSLEFLHIKKLYNAKAKEKNIKFSFLSNFDNLKNIQLFGDMIKLKQVISNLLSNAIKFTQDGGEVFFYICKEDIQKDKIKLKFTVKDSGIGISKEKLNDIFNPFIQEEQNTTRQYGGTGLGLAISKDMIDLMGGKLEVSSAKGKGSSFYFSIEFSYKNSKRNDLFLVNQKVDIENNFSGNILVAEDVIINQKLIKALLDKMNVRSVMVSNGKEAVEEFEKNFDRYDLLLLDINMPVMDGMEAVKKIKKIQLQKNIKIPTVALTANAVKGDKERFLACGFDRYLTKPVDFEKLKGVLGFYLKSKSKEKVEIEKNAQNMGVPLDFYKELLSDFFLMIDKELPFLKEYIDLNDRKNIKEQSHKLKGVCGNLSLTQMYEIFKDIEQLGLSKQEQSEKLASVYDILESMKYLRTKD